MSKLLDPHPTKRFLDFWTTVVGVPAVFFTLTLGFGVSEVAAGAIALVLFGLVSMWAFHPEVPHREIWSVATILAGAIVYLLLSLFRRGM